MFDDLSRYMGRVVEHVQLDFKDLTSGAGNAPPSKQREAKEGKKKVLIVMSHTGGGHLASAKAITAGLEELNTAEELEIKIVDILEEYTLWFPNRLYNWYTIYPVVWGTIYTTTKKTNGGPWLTDPAKFLSPTVVPGFRRCIEAEDPDLVISVHPIIQCVPVSSFVRNGAPYITIVTDLGEGHPWWFNKESDRVFVPTEAMRKEAIVGGMKEHQVMVAGLPIRKGFWDVDLSPANRTKQREDLGLKADKRVVLVVGGGEGMGQMEDTAKALVAALTNKPDLGEIQVVVVCGNNQDLRKKLAKDTKWPAGTVVKPAEDAAVPAAGSGAAAASGEAKTEAQEGAGTAVEGEQKVALSVLGFVTDMERWMLASDIVVTKAGPGAIAEAAATATPIMLYDFLPGQEEGNVVFVKERGMGGYEDTPEKAAEKVCEWLSGGEELLHSMGEAAKAAAYPKAALTIAEHITQMLRELPLVPERELAKGKEEAGAKQGAKQGEGAKEGEGEGAAGSGGGEAGAEAEAGVGAGAEGGAAAAAATAAAAASK